MVKSKIDFFDSVQFTGDWDYVKTKKEKIKNELQKTINSQFHISFQSANSLFLFVYLSLASEEALNFNKVKQIIEKLKGQNQHSAELFNQCRNALNLNWDGVTHLPQLVRNNKQKIATQQNNLFQLGSRISEQQGVNLIKSGLSQRRIRLDFFAHDAQQPLIPAIKNINDWVTIICGNNEKFLLSFFANVQQNKKQDTTEQKKQQQPNKQRVQKEAKNVLNPDDRPIHPAKEQNPTVANTFKDRPIMDVPNPDDRPLDPPVINQGRTRNVIHPDDRLLPPPPGYKPVEAPKPMPTVPRKIVDPDQKLLIPPNKEQNKFSDLKVIGKSYGEKINVQAHKIGEKAQRIGQRVGQKVHNIEKTVQKGIHNLVQQIRHPQKNHWISYLISGAIVIAAVTVLRKS